MTDRPFDEIERDLATLLERTALGDRAAFRELYERTSSRLLGVLSQLVGRGAVAEDLLQEVYIKVWRSAAQYHRQAGSPLAWLCSSARYRAIDHLRARGARAEVALGDLPPGPWDDGDEADRSAAWRDERPGPAEVAEESDDARMLLMCLSTLQSTQQQSIFLAYWHGLSHAEIAAHLRAPLGSVKGWIRRGLITLRTCIDRPGKEEGAA